MTLATNGHFRALVEGQGVPFVELGAAAGYEETARHPDLWHPQRSFGWVFRNLKPCFAPQYELQAGFEAGVTSCFGWGALLASEKLGIPVASVHLQPSVLWSDVAPPVLAGLVGPRWLRSWLYALGERFVIDRTVLPFLNPWRASLGLPPVSRVTRWWHSPHGVVGLFPSWFCPPAPDWPSPLTLTNFPLWNAPGPSVSCEGAVVFTPGTANMHAGAFFEAASRACTLLGVSPLFLTAHPPPGVRAVAYAPLDQVLPGCAAFVHHGGIGSVSQGLAAGVPQLIMPLAHDQFDNAARVQSLGAGTWLPPSRFTGLNVARALRSLLGRRLTFACESGLPAAAAALEGYITPKR